MSSGSASEGHFQGMYDDAEEENGWKWITQIAFYVLVIFR